MDKAIYTQRQRALAGFIIARREAAGLTQVDLAAKLGVYQSFVARMESGHRRIDVVEFLELAEVLGFDPALALKEIAKVGR